MNNTSANYNEEVSTELPEEEVVLGEEPVITAEPEEATAETTEKAPKQKKPKKGKWGYRILSLLVLAIVAAAVVLPMSVFTGKLETKAFYSVVLDLFKGGNSKWLDFLPLVAGNASVQLAYGIMTYVYLLFLVVAAVISLVNLFTGRYRAVKVAAFFAATALAFNALSLYAVSAFALNAAKLDYYLLGGFGGAFLLYFILCVVKNKRAWYNLLNAVLSIAFAGATVYVLCANAGEVETLANESLLNKLLVLVPSVIAALALLIALIRITVKKGRAFELIVFIFELIAGGVLVYLAIGKLTDAKLLFAIVAAGVALVQVLITAIVIGSAKKKARKAKKAAEAEEAPAEEAQEAEAPVEEIEEEVEAVAYDGGPIPVDTTEVQEEPVEEATAEETEEPAPVPAPAPVPTTTVQTAEYDYYNSKAFDPFIATLDGEERNQFTELFILKIKGMFPELPDYVVGGDNRAFFHKFFIYLGQYRDRIPDGLMAKIYSFSTKI